MPLGRLPASGVITSENARPNDKTRDSLAAMRAAAPAARSIGLAGCACQLREGPSDHLVAVLRGVLVAQSRAGGRVSEAAHQFRQHGAGARGQDRSSVTESWNRRSGLPAFSRALQKTLSRVAGPGAWSSRRRTPVTYRCNVQLREHAGRQACCSARTQGGSTCVLYVPVLGFSLRQTSPSGTLSRAAACLGRQEAGR